MEVELSTKPPDVQSQSDVLYVPILSEATPDSDGHHSPEIRLLLLSPCNDHQHEFHGSLKIFRLSDAPSYVAVSYEWEGSSVGFEGDLSLRIHHHTVLLKPNLAQALTCFQKQNSEPRYLWIDAICINQADIKERGHQVQIMSEIYQHATGVSIWLGPAAQDSNLAMDVIDQVSEFPEDMKGKNSRSIKWMQRILYDPFYTPHRLALCSLFRRSYWKRLWIVQEIVLGACTYKPLLWCGDRFSALGHVTKLAKGVRAVTALGNSSTNRKSTTEQKLEIATKVIIDLADHIDELSGNLPNMRQPGLLELLKRYTGNQCTDPRDKIYGLLGVAQFASTSLQVDYSISIQELCRRTALYILETSLRLDLLCSCVWDRDDQASLLLRLEQERTLEQQQQEQRRKQQEQRRKQRKQRKHWKQQFEHLIEAGHVKKRVAYVNQQWVEIENFEEDFEKARREMFPDSSEVVKTKTWEAEFATDGPSISEARFDANGPSWVPKWGKNLGAQLYPATSMKSGTLDLAFKRSPPFEIIDGESIKVHAVMCGEVFEVLPVWISGTQSSEKEHVERLLQILLRVRLSREENLDLFSLDLIREKSTAALLYEILFGSEMSQSRLAEHAFVDRKDFVKWGACFLRGSMVTHQFPDITTESVEQPQRNLFLYRAPEAMSNSWTKPIYGFGLCMANCEPGDRVALLQTCEHLLLIRPFYEDKIISDVHRVLGQCFASTLDESFNLGQVEAEDSPLGDVGQLNDSGITVPDSVPQENLSGQPNTVALDSPKRIFLQ